MASRPAKILLPIIGRIGGNCDQAPVGGSRAGDQSPTSGDGRDLALDRAGEINSSYDGPSAARGDLPDPDRAAGGSQPGCDAAGG
jgi:hypothetical protein